jgi:hypothetical protein
MPERIPSGAAIVNDSVIVRCANCFWQGPFRDYAPHIMGVHREMPVTMITDPYSHPARLKHDGEPASEAIRRAVNHLNTDDPPTVRVRILVAIDRNGKWTATGASWYKDEDTRSIAFIDDLESGEAYHWVEADVPLPTEMGPAIEGTVHATD